MLCGGKGTRLRSMVANVPKPLAPIGDGVFLDHLLEQYFSIGFETATLSACHMAEKIKAYAESSRFHTRLRVIIESEPLGTGGAIAHCLKQLPNGRYLFVNGDTYLHGVSVEDFNVFRDAPGEFSVIGKQIDDGTHKRFGAFKVDAQKGLVSAASDADEARFISFGLYLIDRNAFLLLDLPSMPFGIDSLLRDLLGQGIKVSAIPRNLEFIDIGVPDDYLTFVAQYG